MKRGDLKTWTKRVDEAEVSVSAAAAVLEAAEARESEIPAIDAKEVFGELTAKEAAAQRGDIGAEIDAARSALERAKNVYAYAKDCRLAEARRSAAEIERKPSEVVEAARAREVEAETLLDARRREREDAEEKLADAHRAAEALLAEHEPDARERARHREGLIDWGVRNVTAAGLMQLEPRLRVEAERRIAERAAERRERAALAAAAADRGIGAGEVWPRVEQV